MIEFECACGKPLQAEEQYAGRETRCPECGREQTIPLRSGAIRRDAPPDLARARSTDTQREPNRKRSAPSQSPASGPQPAASGKAIAALTLGLCSLIFNVFTGIPALIVGLLALSDINKSQGRLSGKGLAITGMLLSAFSMFCCLPGLGLGVYRGVGYIHDEAERKRSQNNLKQLVLAMHNYHDANNCFPAAQGGGSGVVFAPIGPGAPGGPGGQPKVSWRVLILPYIEQVSLYNQYNFNEPWDGPNNSRLLTQMPKIYELPGDTTAPPGSTYYQVFVSPPLSFPRAIFTTDPNTRTRMTDITDGTSNTLMIVEAATPVPWTKPDDIPFDVNGVVPSLGTHYNGGCHAAFADGAVRFLPGTLPSSTVKALITCNGGEVVPNF